ncbi:hypothetical protein [Moraxella bovis]|uniref:DUF1364 domain-containing protein n=1 Tax=Moraxella bovis TaxID=476 RepID=A0ABY6M2Y4_MORBO|nr:hypothetical protein [Moraxella bovis]UZA02072.1 hypothetical protein LP092_08680 [Moraxella bovis]UZA18317.1 hypothetical protein LP088_08090 [Moraxella bovis]UZA36489.1 hypothetical protein LP098_05845 [Moraxella bovis]
MSNATPHHQATLATLIGAAVFFKDGGKGMGVKSDDEYTIPLCRACHFDFDTYADMEREKAKAWFLRKLEFVNSVLNEQDNPTENLF